MATRETLTPGEAKRRYDAMIADGWRGHSPDAWRAMAQILCDSAVAHTVTPGVCRSLLDRASDCLVATFVAAGRGRAA